MTFAEMVLFIAGGVGIYFLLRPLQRWLERYLSRHILGRHPRAQLPTIDVTDFTSYRSHKEDDDT